MMYNPNKINYIRVEERRHKVHMLQINNVFVFFLLLNIYMLQSHNM